MADRVQRLMVMYAGTVVEQRPGGGESSAAGPPLHAWPVRGAAAAGPGARHAAGHHPRARARAADMPAGCPFADRCPRADRLPRRRAAGAGDGAVTGAHGALHPSDMTSPLLRVEGLGKRYRLPRTSLFAPGARAGQALEGVSFTLRRAAAWAWWASPARARARWHGW
jgi:ABC-type glutathione transport system ATPase component